MGRGLCGGALLLDQLLASPVIAIAGGTDEVLLSTIAEKVMRLPQDYRPDKGVPFNQLT